MEVPAQVLTNQVFLAKITMKNTGGVAWQGESQPILYAQDPPRNKAWGTDFIYMRQGNSAKPGEEFTFISHSRAPGTPGEHVFQWRLGRRGRDGQVIYFGQATAPRTIKVEARPALAPPPGPLQPTSGKRIMTFDDFEYVGSFKVPPQVGEGGAGFSESGLALRKMSDGTKRLFVNYTHPRQTLFEVAIPKPAKLQDGDYRSLSVADVKKVWGSLRIAIPKSGDVDSIAPNGGFWWDEGRSTLYWTYYHGYRTGEAPPVLAGSRLGDDGTITHAGPWRIPQPASSHYKAYWGGITRLPKAFADQYTSGRTLAMGFGGYYSILRRAAAGRRWRPSPSPTRRGRPSIWSSSWPIPPAPQRPAMATTSTATVPAESGTMCPPIRTSARGRWMTGAARASSSTCPTSMGISRWSAWAPAESAMTTAASTRPATRSGGTSTAPTSLAGLQRTRRKLGEILPHSRAKVSYPATPADAPDHWAVTGACFDGDEKLLYLYKPGIIPVGKERHGCVHVYRVR